MSKALIIILSGIIFLFSGCLLLDLSDSYDMTAYCSLTMGVFIFLIFPALMDVLR